MNGARTTYMRRGYLLTALAAAVLLAASSGTAWAQRVTIGFDPTSGSISEKAFLNVNSLEAPQKITVRVNGLRAGSQRESDIRKSLGNVSITPDGNVYIARVSPQLGYRIGGDTDGPFVSGDTDPTPASTSTVPFVIAGSHFEHSDEVVLVVAQSGNGTGDTNFLNETIELKLSVDPQPDTSATPVAETPDPASVRPDTFTLMVEDSQAAPVAKFLQPNFTLSEESSRTVSLDIAAGSAAGIPSGTASRTGVVSVRVSNHSLVTFGNCPSGRTDPQYNRKLFRIVPGDDWSETSGGSFTSTALLQTDATTRSVGLLADNPHVDDEDNDQDSATETNVTADLVIHGCGDGAGIRDPYITLTILTSNLESRTSGNISIGPPLMIAIDSDEAAPTLSFSPTDVEIDEGGETETVLLAEGPNASDVRMVKLMVEGDAMVDLYQGDKMLEEMGGYVTVDLGGNSSARLMAMSTSDPDLMDGEMKHKAWKLMDDSAQGVNIGDGYWFKVDVRGSTAVPALPLVGQLLLALFLMAGGSRLYRRRQG